MVAFRDNRSDESEPRRALTLVAAKKIVRLLEDGTGHWQRLAMSRGADRLTYRGLLFFGEQRCLSYSEAAALAEKLGCRRGELFECSFHGDVSTPNQAHPSVCFMTGDAGSPGYDHDWECWGDNPKVFDVFSRWLESHALD